jgi:hypothetical protein
MLVPFMDLKDGVELGLRLVRSKLTYAGTTGFHAFPAIFEQFISEICARSEKEAMLEPMTTLPENADVAGSDESDEYAVIYPHVRIDYSPGCHSVRVRDDSYSLTRGQAAIVAVLLEFWKRGTPDVTIEHLQLAAGFRSERVDTMFQNSDSWGKLVGNGRRKGTYRILEETLIEHQKAERTRRGRQKT